MKMFKGPVGLQCQQLTNRIRLCKLIVTLQMFQINELENDFSRHPHEKLIAIQQRYHRLNEYKNHIKVLQEKLIIISCG
jgi:hypothetical protein